ncbi:serine/threonine kinase [Fragilaria crotonensis]|nr:serine/threonine kinase [Fragilaria crotonensis]
MPLSDNDVALIINAYDGNLNEVRALLLDGANVNAQGDSDGATALYMASQNGHLEVVRELLQHDDVDVNLQRTDDGTTALFIASQDGHLEVVRALLQHDNVDVNLQCPDDGSTALYIASQEGHLEVVRELLQRDNVEVNLQRTSGSTALIMASQEGHVEVVHELLQHDNVDVTLQRTDDGATALYIASYCGHLEVVRELLQHDKVDVNLQCPDIGATALYIASQEGHLEVVRELLQRDNVEVNLQRTSGSTALIMASHNGHLEVVRNLLQIDNVDVNLQQTDGSTALYMASQEGHVEVVRELLQHDKVDVNAKNKYGSTALFIASHCGHLEVVRALLQHDKVDMSLKDTSGKTARDVATIDEVVNAFDEHENRKSLCNVMTTCKAEPVELSHHYIKLCITERKLGSGAFGDVFLAEDRDLPESKEFAVKMIKLSRSSDSPDEKNLESLQRELSTLKRFRHPNIIVLYGYNFKGRAGEPFLVYEYAANGSLDCFLKDDDMRARLSAATRLTIMYEVARAVHFLHTGAAGVKVYHRDIKSANICLMKDFTPKLIDCGLAKFVLDRHEAVPSESIPQSGSTQGTAIGTHLYRCPEYISKKGKGINCDYIPAYDVYSFGVVMAELILGRLNDGKRTNVLQTYVQNDEEKPIVDGWKQLKNHADGRADWNAEALELVCKTVIGCITLPAVRRLSTDKLRDLLKYAKNKQDKTSDIEPKDAIAELDKILDNTDKRNSEPECVGKGLPCCNCDKPPFVVKCNVESHPLCAKCLDKAVREAPASIPATFQLRCLVSGCPSQPFTIDDICEHVRDSTWSYHWHKETKKVIIHVADEIKDEMKKLVSVVDSRLPEWLLEKANADRLKQCPTVVVITRIAVDRSKNLEKWFKNVKEQKYQLVFYCERSGKPGHEPFEISVDRKWMVKVAPWLRIAINIGAAWDPSKVSPAVLKEFPLPVHSKEMEALINALGKEENNGQLQTLQGDALEAIAKMANEEENLKKWRDEMEAVDGENGRKMWVKKRISTG